MDGNIRHSHYLERYKSSQVRKIISLLNKVDKDLVKELNKLYQIEERGVLPSAKQKRLEQLIDQVNAAIMELTSSLYDKTREELEAFAEYEAEFQAKLMEAAIGHGQPEISLTRPSVSQLHAVVTARPFQGALLKDWYASIGADTGRKIKMAINIGIAEGQTTDQIIRRIRGTRALSYEDGLLHATRRDVASVVRTAIAHTANFASEELYAANDDLVVGVRWVSTLDGRTTAICASRDGRVYPVNKGPRPPAHFNCRSTTVPDLGDEIEGSRASATGPVSAKLTYDEWLRKQSAGFQEEVLGVAKAKLFRGGLKIEKFLDASGKEYTLSQLKRMDIAS